MISANGYIGGVMAVQGITDATVLLHGQDGCRSALLQSLEMCPRAMDVCAVSNRTYRGIAGLPISGITEPDYTGGSQRLYDVSLRHISDEQYRLIVSVCAPGASILGDDLRDDPDGRYMVLDTNLLGDDLWTGFDRTVSMILNRIDNSPEDIIPDTVCILGLSIVHKDWQATRAEFAHILKKSGLRVLCSVGAGCSLDELKLSLRSEYCIVICPEFCRETMEVYRRHGSRIISMNESPVGFDAVARLHDEIRDATGLPLDGARSMLNDARLRAFDAVRRHGGCFTGISFNIDSVPSICDPLSSWLIRSFGMVPADDDPDIMFTSGDEAVMSERSGLCRKGISLGYPSSVPEGFIRRPLFGMDGCLYILDELFSCPSDLVRARGGTAPTDC